MKAAKLVMAMASILLLFAVAAQDAAAQGGGRRQAKEEVEMGGWSVAYSAEMTEGDAAYGNVEPGVSLQDSEQDAVRSWVVRSWAESLVRRATEQLSGKADANAVRGFEQNENAQRDVRRFLVKTVRDMLRSRRAGSDMMDVQAVEVKAGVMEYIDRRDNRKFVTPYVGLRLKSRPPMRLNDERPMEYMERKAQADERPMEYMERKAQAMPGIESRVAEARVASMPNFPWPPPKPSASIKIPSNFLLNQNGIKLLKNVAEKFENAFSEAGYSDIAYYRVPDGFALVSKLEQINSDGTPKDPRWSSDIAASRIFDLTSYIKALFTASPGQYRIIAFIVTSNRFVPSSETIKREEAMAWLDNGMKALPSKIGEEEYTNEHYCTALIYEFEQPGKDKEPFFKDSSKSRLSGYDHLEKSGLLSKLEK